MWIGVIRSLHRPRDPVKHAAICKPITTRPVLDSGIACTTVQSCIQGTVEGSTFQKCPRSTVDWICCVARINVHAISKILFHDGGNSVVHSLGGTSLVGRAEYSFNTNTKAEGQSGLLIEKQRLAFALGDAKGVIATMQGEYDALLTQKRLCDEKLEGAKGVIATMQGEYDALLTEKHLCDEELLRAKQDHDELQGKYDALVAQQTPVENGNGCRHHTESAPTHRRLPY
jgi:hypothetical protein